MHMCVPIINVIITSNSNTIRQYGHWSRFRLGFKVDAANLPQAASGVMYSTVRFAWYVYVEPEPNHEQEQAHTNLRYCFIYKLQYLVKVGRLDQRDQQTFDITIYYAVMISRVLHLKNKTLLSPTVLYTVQYYTYCTGCRNSTQI